MRSGRSDGRVFRVAAVRLANLHLMLHLESVFDDSSVMRSSRDAIVSQRLTCPRLNEQEAQN